MEKERLMKKKLRAKQQGNTRQLAEATNDLGDLYFNSGNSAKALAEYSEAVEVYESLGDKLNCIIAHRMIGEIEASFGKYECALRHLNLHLEGAKELGNDAEMQRGFATLGRTFFLLAHTLPEKSNKRKNALHNAKKLYSKSIQLCNDKKLEGIPRDELMQMRGRLLLNQGLVQEAQMEPEAGITLIKAAITIFSANEEGDELHRACLTLAALYEKQGNKKEALAILNRAIQNENISKKADALVAKAQLFLRNGEWMQARKVLVALRPMKNLAQSMRKEIEKLLRIAVTLCKDEDKLNSEDTEEDHLKLYEDLGDAASAAQCYDKALEYYKKMLSHAEKNKSKRKITEALVSLAQTYKDARRYTEALPFARRELKLCSDPREACRSALILADLLESAGSTNSEIIDMYKLALSKAETSGQPSLEVTALKEYLHYVDTQKSEIQTRLNLLYETTPGLESEKEIPPSTEIGADIDLDELSDLELSEEERNTRQRSRSSSTRSRSTNYVIRKNAKGETQLHTACIRRNIERVKKLLEDGHPTDVRDYGGWTPLHEAANHGSVEIVELLISAGANVNDHGGPESVTPLHDAADCGHFAVMNLLIQKGAKIHLTTKKGDSVLDCFEEWRNRVGRLSDAAEYEYQKIHRKLFAKGAYGRKKGDRMGRPVPRGNRNRIDSDAMDED